MLQNQNFGLIRSLVWPVFPSEMRKIMPMFVILFLLSFNHSILWMMKDSLIVTTAGAESLPFIKVWAILPALIFLTYIFAKLSNRYRQETIFYLLITSFLALYALFAFCIYPNRDHLQPLESAAYLDRLLPAGFRGLITLYRHWTITGFYVICEMWNTIIISVLFWRFANEITQLSEGRRFYSVLSIGYNLASIVAGIVTASLTNTVRLNSGWEQTMMLLILIVIGSGLITIGTFRWMHKHVVTDRHDRNLQEMGLKLTLRESLLHVAKSRYLICMAAIVVAYGLSISLFEVVWKDQLKNLYPATLDYNHYMGHLEVIQGLLALVIALGTAEGIRRLGWTTASLVTPVLTLICMLCFFAILFFLNLVPSFTLMGFNPLMIAVFLGSAQNCIAKACKYSIADSTKEMAFIPLSPESKIKGKTAIDGLGSRAGKSGGAIIHQGLLIIFTTVSASSPYVGIITILALVIWIISICHLGKKKELMSLRDHEVTPIKEARSAPFLL